MHRKGGLVTLFSFFKYRVEESRFENETNAALGGAITEVHSLPFLWPLVPFLVKQKCHFPQNQNRDFHSMFLSKGNDRPDNLYSPHLPGLYTQVKLTYSVPHNMPYAALRYVMSK